MKHQPDRSNAGTNIRVFATTQAADLLRRAAFQANRAARAGNIEAVHDLRVSLRRLTQCLRLFSQFFPPGRARKLRQRLAGVMDLASQVRDIDVALALLAGSSVRSAPSLAAGLQSERKSAEHALFAALKRWGQRDFERKWRRRLEL